MCWRAAFRCSRTRSRSPVAPSRCWVATSRRDAWIGRRRPTVMQRCGIRHSRWSRCRSSRSSRFTPGVTWSTRRSRSWCAVRPVVRSWSSPRAGRRPPPGRAPGQPLSQPVALPSALRPARGRQARFGLRLVGQPADPHRGQEARPPAVRRDGLSPVEYLLDRRWTVDTVYGDAAEGSLGLFWKTRFGGLPPEEAPESSESPDSPQPHIHRHPPAGGRLE
jgi:hypothetical protein